MRSGERLLIVALIGVICLLLAVPAIGDAIRDIVVFLFGKRGSRYVETLTAILGSLGLLGAFVRWLFLRNRTETTLPPVPVQGSQAPTAEPDIRTENSGRSEEVLRTRADARRISRELIAFVQERDEDDPFHREEISRNMDSPEYKDLSARYGAHMDETLRLYRSNQRPNVASVRDAFADLGIKDPELDRLYQDPRNYKDMRTLAARLLAMADALSR